MPKKKKVPNPGSNEALELGCTCAVFDNGHGKGYMGMKDVFCIELECPLHGGKIKIKSKKTKI